MDKSHKHTWKLTVDGVVGDTRPPEAAFVCKCGEACAAVPAAEYVPKSLDVVTSADDLPVLARATVESLRARIGCDIVCVFIGRSTDNKLGIALDCGETPVDTTCMSLLEALVQLRGALIKTLVEQATRP